MKAPDQWNDHEELEMSTARLEILRAIHLITIATGRMQAVTGMPFATGSCALQNLNHLDSRLERWLKVAKYVRENPEVLADPEEASEYEDYHQTLRQRIQAGNNSGYGPDNNF